MKPSLRGPLVIAASALVLGVLVLSGEQGAPRAVAALWFLLACPGLAIVPLLPEVGPRAALVVAVSLAVDTLVGTAMLVPHVFWKAAGLSIGSGALTLVAVCVAGGGAQVLRWALAHNVTEVRLHE